MTEFSNNFHLI